MKLNLLRSTSMRNEGSRKNGSFDPTGKGRQVLRRSGEKRIVPDAPKTKTDPMVKLKKDISDAKWTITAAKRNIKKYERLLARAKKEGRKGTEYLREIEKLEKRIARAEIKLKKLDAEKPFIQNIKKLGRKKVSLKTKMQKAKAAKTGRDAKVKAVKDETAKVQAEIKENQESIKKVRAKAKEENAKLSKKK